MIKYNYNNQFKLVIGNYSYVKLIQLTFIGFMKEITREIVNMKTINCTAEGYFHSCRSPCAGQCVLELQASSVTTVTGTARCRTEDIY